MNISNQKNIRLFLCIWVLTQIGDAIASIEIDTRITSTHRYKSFVFDTQQTFTAGNFARGDVEFRAGLLPNAFNISMQLSVTPPLSGEINGGPDGGSGYGIATYDIYSDLTLGNVYFDAPEIALNTRFSFQRPSKIFLTSDLSVKSTFGLNLGFVTLATTGTVDGQGKRINITPGSAIQAFLGGKPLTFKNVAITGGQGYTGNGVQTFFQDVEIIAPLAGSLGFSNCPFYFVGKHNILGYNSLIGFGSNFLGVSVLIETLSRVTVTPGTTLDLGRGSVYVPPLLSFQDATSELYLDNCIFDYTPDTGPKTLTLTKGTVYINGNVLFKSSNGTGTVQFGDGVNPANNLNVLILPGSKLIIDNGMTIINANV